MKILTRKKRKKQKVTKKPDRIQEHVTNKDEETLPGRTVKDD